MTERLQCFDSFVVWVNKASSWLTRRGPHVKAICLDVRGRLCADGADFMRARDEGAFPVRWLWPDQVAAELAEVHAVVGDLRGDRRRLEEQKTILLKALRWYAEPLLTYAVTQMAEPRSAVHADGGRRARDAIEQALDVRRGHDVPGVPGGLSP